jgi:hypothetical protein
MTIREVLEHPWLLKFNKKLSEAKKKKDGNGYNFEIYTNSG